MIIRRKIGRLHTKNSKVGNVGRRTLSHGTNIVRRMNITRLPDISNMAPLEPEAAHDSSNNAGLPPVTAYGTPIQRTANKEAISNSDKMPSDLQAIWDRFGPKEGSKDSGFVQGIIQRNKDKINADKERMRKAGIQRRPENARYEPNPRTAPADTSSDDGFGEEPVFETKRTRSVFEYVNVTSPDKVQRSEETSEPEVEDTAWMGEDLPDAMPGSYTIDDHEPTEMMDLSEIQPNSDTSSPKVDAPQRPSSVQRSTDASIATSEGQNIQQAQDIQSSVDTTIDQWATEDDSNYVPFEHGAADQGDTTPSEPASNIQRSIDTDTNRPSRTSAPIPNDTNAAVTPPSSDMSPDTSNVQRSPDADINTETFIDMPAVSRNVASPSSTPSQPANIQRAVQDDINSWQADGDSSSAEPLNYAPSSDSAPNVQRNVEADAGSSESVSRNVESPSSAPSQPANIQRAVQDDINSWHADADPSSAEPLNYAPSSDSSPNVQRSIETDAGSSESVSRNVESPSSAPSQPANIQRAVQDDINSWHADADPSSAEPLNYAPSSDSSPNVQRNVEADAGSNEPIARSAPSQSANIQRAVQDDINSWQTDDIPSSAEPLNYAPSSDSSPNVQRSVETDPSEPISRSAPSQSANIQRAVQDDINSWQTDDIPSSAEPLNYAPSSDSSPNVQRSVETDPSEPISRSAPSQPTNIQRAVQDDINAWQTDDIPSSAEPLNYAPSSDSSPNVQRSVETDPSEPISRSAPSQSTNIQRAVQDDINSWHADASPSSAEPLNYAPSSDSSPNIQRSIETDPSEPISRSAPSQPTNIQRAVQDDIDTWQTDGIPSSAEPLNYAPSNDSPNVQRSVVDSQSSNTVQRQSRTAIENTPDGRAHNIQRAVMDDIGHWQNQEDLYSDTVLNESETPEWQNANLFTDTETLQPVNTPSASGDASQGYSMLSAKPPVVQRSTDTNATPSPSVSPSSPMQGNYEPLTYAAPPTDEVNDRLPTQSIPLDEALFGDMPPIQRSPANNNSKTEQDLLSLLNLPTDTTIDHGPTQTVEAPSNMIQRTVEIGDSRMPTTSNDGDSSADGSQDSQQGGSADEMAEKVYQILKRRFKVEFERGRGKRS